MIEHVSNTYLTQPVQRIGTDRLNLHDFPDRLKSLDVEVEMEADDSYGWWHCGMCVVSASIFVGLYRPVSLSMSLSINAGHLKQHSAPVKRRKAEEGRIITLLLICLLFSLYCSESVQFISNVVCLLFSLYVWRHIAMCAVILKLKLVKLKVLSY
jgi:dipeptide/tripeptide permease